MLEFQKDWQVETGGQIYAAELDELIQWIAEGAILPSDKVRRGNLRWLTAEKVPELYNFFNSTDVNIVFSHTTAEKRFEPEDDDFRTQFSFEGSTEEDIFKWSTEKVCNLHTISDAAYACDLCLKYFCKVCPKSYGGTVRICPVCNSLCRAIDEPVNSLKSVAAINKPYSRIKKKTENQNRKSISSIFAAVKYISQFLTSFIWAAKPAVSSSLDKIRRR